MCLTVQNRIVDKTGVNVAIGDYSVRTLMQIEFTLIVSRNEYLPLAWDYYSSSVKQISIASLHFLRPVE